MDQGFAFVEETGIPNIVSLRSSILRSTAYLPRQHIQEAAYGPGILHRILGDAKVQ